MRQMRGIFDHLAAFMKSLTNQTDVALLKVAYTAVSKFCRAARRALGEVRFFDQ
jgi:hypothetical protein